MRIYAEYALLLYLYYRQGVGAGGGISTAGLVSVFFASLLGSLAYYVVSAALSGIACSVQFIVQC